MGGRRLVISACVLWMHFCSVAAMTEPEVCYLLDGILFFYGLILTVLYCRIRMSRSKAKTAMKMMPTEEGVYTGLTPHAQDVYESVGTKTNAPMK